MFGSYLAYAFEQAGLDLSVVSDLDAWSSSPASYQIGMLARAVDLHAAPCLLALDEIDRLPRETVDLVQRLGRSGAPQPPPRPRVPVQSGARPRHARLPRVGDGRRGRGVPVLEGRHRPFLPGLAVPPAARRDGGAHRRLAGGAAAPPQPADPRGGPPGGGDLEADRGLCRKAPVARPVAGGPYVRVRARGLRLDRHPSGGRGARVAGRAGAHQGADAARRPFVAGRRDRRGAAPAPARPRLLRRSPGAGGPGTQAGPARRHSADPGPPGAARCRLAPRRGGRRPRRGRRDRRGRRGVRAVAASPA